ncbi:hypothetical protein [Aureibacter tunicatorum]|uniref:hypothetical protein n=1 Tax=Aureibacter tunicatorum TaxID=866807 RepID=UPI00286BA33A|nr:hypothetical protein [Aureibacter tunicatorum]
MSAIVISLTIISVWLFGLGNSATIIHNSILSTSIISGSFLLFTTYGLYNGYKLKDNLGGITDRFRLKSIKKIIESVANLFNELADTGSGADNIIGYIISIILWIIVSIVIGILFWVFSTVLWGVILIFSAMLYWIYFRALRLVFKQSYVCKGKLIKSLTVGSFYTLLYNANQQ